MAEIISKAGGFSVFQGKAKGTGKEYTKFHYYHKDKNGEIKNVEIMLFHEQVHSLSRMFTRASDKLLDYDAEIATELMLKSFASKAIETEPTPEQKAQSECPF
jgi:translation elongation factor EF-4